MDDYKSLHELVKEIRDAVTGGDFGGGEAESAVLTTKSITANGTYSAQDDEADGYSEVTVNVESDLTTKSITANGTYSA